MKKYDSYKDSGVEWIGEIPVHWVKSKLKFSMKDDGFRSGPFGSSLITNQLLDEGRFLVYSPEHIVNDNVEFPLYVPKEREEELSKYLVKEGDIIIPIVGTLGRGKIITTKEPIGILNQRLCRISPNSNKINLDLLLVLLTESDTIRTQYNLEKRGSILDHITKEILFNLTLPLPPITEQQQIVQFLDTKTSLIDSLIEKTQRKIELLKEKRTSLINHVVTKGLNPNVEMKDSGVEWIGEIPSHWIVKKVSYLSRDMISGPFGSSLKKEFHTKTGYKIYGQEQVIKDDFNFGDYYISEEKFHELKRCEIFTNDILISCVGTFGKISLVPIKFERGILNPRLLKITPNDLVEPNYFLKLLRSKISFVQFESLSRGGTMGVINLDILRRLKFPIPPIPEQQQIVEYLDEQTQIIDTTITKEQKRIELLKEYRQSLISNVVTGKIKVTTDE
jgi:type I restriction enzyme, S subunit